MSPRVAANRRLRFKGKKPKTLRRKKRKGCQHLKADRSSFVVVPPGLVRLKKGVLNFVAILKKAKTQNARPVSGISTKYKKNNKILLNLCKKLTYNYIYT